MKAAALHNITGWQAARRRALALVRQQMATADLMGDTTTAMAWAIAAVDINDELRERAAAEIDEGMHMHFVHETMHKAAA